MEVIALFNLYANGVSVFAKAPLFRTRAHAVGVAVKPQSWPGEEHASRSRLGTHVAAN